MRFVTISAFIVTALFTSAALASPQSVYECPGTSEATAHLVPELGGVGSFIYAADDERHALVGYAEKSDEFVVLDGGNGEGEFYVGKHVRFFKASEASGLSSNVQVISTNQSFDCKSTKVVSNLAAAGDKG